MDPEQITSQQDLLRSVKRLRVLYLVLAGIVIACLLLPLCLLGIDIYTQIPAKFE